MEPVINNPNLPYVLIKHGDPMADLVFNSVEELIDSVDSELSITIAFLALFKRMYSWCNCHEMLNNHTSSGSTDTSFKVMLKYIQTNYANTLTLADIAKARELGNS